MGQVAVHLVGDRPCVGAEPKPEGAQLGPGDEEERVPEEAGPAVGVVGQGVDRSQGEGGLAAGGPAVAGQTDQGRGLEGEACRHGWEDPPVAGGDPGRVGEDPGAQVVQVVGEGGPASLLKENTSGKHFEAQSH